MGTNFYWKELPKELKQYEKNIQTITDDKDMNPLWHIGKRSAAGRYCIDCGITFCKHGVARIHYDDNPYKFLTPEWEEAQKYYWYTKCPMCGKEGIPVCSFTWTSMKQKEIINHMAEHSINDKLIINEYDEEFTPFDFLYEELDKCPVEYQSFCEFC